MKPLRINFWLLIWALPMFPGLLLAAEADDPFARSPFKYPRKVDLSPLPVLDPAKQTNWTRLDTAQEACFRLTRPNFFANGDDLTIRFGENGSAPWAEWIKLTRAGNPRTEITFPVKHVTLSFGTRPASFHDFDRNGLTDIKLVFHIGGVAGHGNVGQVFYLFQFKSEWRLIQFYVRDVSYTWECDLDGDGRCELLRGHHQDKQKVVYRDPKRKTGGTTVFEKYLFINAYSLTPAGLKLCNHLSRSLPKVLPFHEPDPFDVTRDASFIKANQFRLPDGYTNQIQRIPQ